MSHRIALVLHLDPSWDVEAYQLAGRLTDTPGVRSVEVVPLEVGDELMRMSSAKNAIEAGLKTWIETDSMRAAIAHAVQEHTTTEPDWDPPPGPDPWPADHDRDIHKLSEERRAELEAERVKKRTELTLLEQVSRRAELEELDRRAAEATALRQSRRADDDPCAGGCSRGGEGPACGRRGCTG